MDVVIDQSDRIAVRFPTPPGAVLRALELLHILRRGDPDEMAAAGDLTDLPRPWDPASCPDELREAIWEWCSDIAAWLNHEYIWRPTQMIPPCWPDHPHLARELAVLAILRWNAHESTAPEPMEEWHRYSFPMFCDRMISRLGESGCRTAKHVDWPAEGRYAAFISDENTTNRNHVIYTDTRPIAHLHAARPT
jgi:hypothetical protein